ncbi:MAG: tetratricopeptide repeat protein [Candidatus Obscuribacter sp.]|nr:tetratricopeptide repeat protein [Candidatus Obscuribacter sp.]
MANFNTNFFLNLGDSPAVALLPLKFNQAALLPSLILVMQASTAYAKPAEVSTVAASGTSAPHPQMAVRRKKFVSEADAAHTIAENHYRHKRCDACIASCNESIKKFPRDHRFYVLKALSYDYMIQFDKAVETMELCVKTLPKNPQAYLEFGSLYLNANKYLESIPQFEKALKLQVDLPRAYHERSIALSATGRDKEAIDDMTKYIEYAPEKARGYQWRAATYRKIKQYKPAIADITKAMETSPGKRFEFLIERSDMYMCDKDYKKAIADIDRVLTINPQDDSLWLRKGQCLMELKDYKAAIEAYTKTAELSDSSTAYMARSKAYEKLGDKVRAAKDKAMAEKLLKEKDQEPL